MTVKPGRVLRLHFDPGFGPGGARPRELHDRAAFARRSSRSRSGAGGGIFWQVRLSRDVQVADFNLDGVADLAVAVSSDDSPLFVILGNGDGTFQPPVAVAAGVAANSLVFAVDFNRDGRPDLMIQGDGLQILAGNGDGGFRNLFNIPLGSAGGSFTVYDFNRDGKADVAIDSPGGVDILLGKGDGTFAGPVTYPAGTATGSFRQLIAADLTGDGTPDLLVFPASSQGSPVYLLRGNGDGSFQQPDEIPALLGAWNLTFADFNGDGRLDVAAPILLDDSSVESDLRIALGVK